ncbi:hypothetical protein QFC20_000531 [Naganishia adeliensis]|uniref:Uncharacterized protein n=1 Tax=Naganishia adeliensis TaxID=92952 RepID=A0ACC2WYR4_9TREE|nr:hypothetical protein QFC20_000531 [Naganishia adeliensis]
MPAAWAERFPNSFYKITRTNLRVKPADGSGSTQHLARDGSVTTTAAGKVDVKGKAKEEDDADFDADDMEIGEVSTDAGATNSSRNSDVELTGKRAHGQAWGVLFWNGQPKFPFKQNWLEAQTATSSSTYTPQSKVRRALSESWKTVDVSTLSPETREAVQQLETGKRRDWLARREKVKVENLSVKDLKGLEAWRRKQEQQV